MRRFVLAAFALTVFAACQPATTELTVEQKAEIAAEVELVHGQLWDAWRETDLHRGMDYYRNSPEFTFAMEGQLFNGYDALHDAAHEMFASTASQTITLAESQTTVLAPDVVCVMEQGIGAATDTLGVTGPANPFAFTAIWVLRDGEWKVDLAHFSNPATESQ